MESELCEESENVINQMDRHLPTLSAKRYIDFGEQAMVVGRLGLKMRAEVEDFWDLRGRNSIFPEYK
jgi:hypothetical protein